MDTEVREIEGRERILGEARRLFLERAFAETSMQDIADASKLTKAALYYHFRDKNELFFTILRSELERVGEGLQELLSTGEPLRVRLQKGTVYLLATMEGDLTRLVFDSFKHICAEDTQQFHAQKAPFIFEKVAPFLADAAQNGEVRRDLDPQFLASMWLALVFNQLRAIRLGVGFPMDSNKLAGAIVDVFLDGAGGEKLGKTEAAGLAQRDGLT